MATTPTATPRRGPGRPRKTFGDPDQVLPPPPTPKPDPDTFFSYWQAIEQQAPERTVGYIYRGWPKIDREKLEKPSNIHKGGYFTAEWLADRFGSGEYLIMVNDPYREKAQQKLCQTVVTINDPTRPPIIDDLQELDMTWEKNQPFIAQLRMKGVRLPGDHNLPPEVSTALKALSERPKEEDPSKKRNEDLMAQTMSTLLQNNLDPSKKMQELREFLSLVKPQNDGFAPMVGIFERFFEQQQHQTREMIKLMQAQREPAPAPAAVEDPITASLKQKMIERILTQIDNPEPAPPADAPGWVMAVMPFAGRLVEAAYILAQGYYHQAQQPRAQAPYYVATPAAPVAPAGTAPAPPAPAMPAQPQPQTPTGEPSMFAAVIEYIRQPLNQALSSGLPTGAGLRFRDDIIALYGQIIYNQVRQTPNAKDEILKALARDSQLGPIVKEYPVRMDRFVQEFLSDEESNDEE